MRTINTENKLLVARKVEGRELGKADEEEKMFSSYRMTKSQG